MSKNVLILDGNNEEGSLTISSLAFEMQLEIKGVGLDNPRNVYLSFETSNMVFGQTFTVTDTPAWKSVVFPSGISGALKITRPNYNMPPETADGVSVVISGIRWR